MSAPGEPRLSERTLPSGLRLRVLAPFGGQMTSIVVGVRAGFAHEDRDRLGISHMVEHLCFSDNRLRTFPGFRAEIERLGGFFNGRTGETKTSFSMTLLTEHWREGLKLLRDIALNPRFDPEACAREVRVLNSEMLQFNQRWLAWFYERGWFRPYFVLLRDRLWSGMHLARTFHRYGDLSTGVLKEWHERHYRPGNMAVSAVGDLDPAEVEAEAGRLFEGPAAEPSPPLRHPEPSAPAGGLLVATRLGNPFWNQSTVAVGAFNGGPEPGERAVWDVAQEYLQHRAFDCLRLEHCLAYSTWCSMELRRGAECLLLGASVKRGEEARTERLLRDVLARALEEDAPASELEGIRNMLLAGHALTRSDPGWFAADLAASDFGEFPADVEDYPARVRAVTPAHARALLRRLLSGPAPITVRQIPLLSVAQTVALAIAAAAAVAAALARLILR